MCLLTAAWCLFSLRAPPFILYPLSLILDTGCCTARNKAHKIVVVKFKEFSSLKICKKEFHILYLYEIIQGGLLKIVLSVESFSLKV